MCLITPYIAPSAERRQAKRFSIFSILKPVENGVISLLFGRCSQEFPEAGNTLKLMLIGTLGIDLDSAQILGTRTIEQI